MNIHSTGSTHSILWKNTLQEHPQRQNQKLNKVCEMIETKISNKAVSLELSEEAIQKLKIRNLYRTEKLENKIEEYYKTFEQKANLLTEIDKTLDEILNSFKSFWDKAANQKESSEPAGEQQETPAIEETPENHNLNDELLAEANDIEKSIKDIADLIEAVEKMKAQREGVSYSQEDSLATQFRNADLLNDPSSAWKAVNEAKKMLLDELLELSKRVGEMEKEIEKMMQGLDAKQLKYMSESKMADVLEMFIENEKIEGYL
ncbi:hypothetical protein [Geosporobacter ferrireducens]|uniref:Uncharacterized protein n=1 Tax=Geosporobacter ferrireducens TaxID=1424294 RepID=A0A1D8GGA1_9FIRM|nr:hypothetical protein [Geosporobacter ferrireducens]AOT69941.1 hypothetical protein Gferi_10305 [Geosporobacter ferrireducens]MTI54363.1 hypothetical protein [Geosporobacter ferrireducens]